MSTVIDDQINATNISNLASDLVEGRRWDARFSRADSETRVGGQTYLHEKLRLDSHYWNMMMINSIANDRFGTGLASKILDDRSSEDQPQQGTYNDPNYRSGAVAPGRSATVTTPAGGTVQIGG